MPNKHAKEYINYYLSLTTEPQYAIMLKGAWGSGKTWFIDSVLNEYRNNNVGFKFLKVSLYGVNSVEQIEEEFYRQLHPILSNKKFIFGAKVLKNTLKATLKVDLNGDNKDDASVNLEIPKIDLSDFSREPNGFVLVFDDVERSGIALSLLFGYINHFVEVNGYKAILIANEDEILRKNNLEDEEKSTLESSYLRTKEKLVGRTFEINSELHSACKVFLSVISSSSVANIFKSEMQSIENIYNLSGYNNLRHLRQFFLDVERLTHLMGDKYVNNEDFLRVFYQQLLVFSMEYRGGALTYKDFNSIGEINWGFYVNGEEIKSKYDELISKYSISALNEKLLTGDVWRAIICDGKVTENLLLQLDATRFFRSVSAPSWQYLWRYHELSESVLNAQSAIARENFFSGNITELGELLMVASILIELASNEFINDSIQDVIDKAIIQIDNYYNKMNLIEVQKEYIDSYMNEPSSLGGLGFLNRDGDHFKLIADHVKLARKERFDKSLPEFAEQFRIELESGSLTLSTELSQNNKRKLNIYGLPFLHWLDPSSFIESYVNLDPSVMKLLSYNLRSRYSDEYTRESLREELDWVVKLKKIAEDFIQRPNISAFKKFHVNFLIDYVLNQAIKFFD